MKGIWSSELRRRAAGIATAALAVTGSALSGAVPVAAAAVFFSPTASDAQFVASGETPPTQAACNSFGRRCFTPATEAQSYNLTPLFAAGDEGQGQTIAIVDAYGSETMPHDLKVFNNAFGLPHMCGEEAVACAPGMPSFTWMRQGNVSTTPTANGHQEDHSAWALEVALDVEWAHSMAPMANILLVTTPTAETLGVQGFPDFMKAEDAVIQGHMASVISQSFASAEDAFASTQSLLNLRYAFQDAAANRVSVFGSSGDNGTANVQKSPVGQGGSLIPFPTVEWPASDPLVTGVGGTYLCTNATTGLGVDNVSPGGRCRAILGQREVGWTFSGGGFSHVFSRPSFQNTLPAGSTAIGSMRGVPDIALQASAGTGVLIYTTNPFVSSDVNNLGWWVIGGTSSSSPQWAGLTAVANQMNGGHPLGSLNPLLYQIAGNPVSYANDFFDVTTGANQVDPTVPGYPATTGWDPVTGLGTPNAANLLPALIAACSCP
jgi:subtilase family serine protease